MVSLEESDVRVVIWTEVTSERIAALERELNSQYRRCGQRLVYVGVVPEDSPTPDGEARKVMADCIRRAQEFFGFSGMIFQGSGLKASIKRTAFAGILMLAMKGKWHVVGSADDLIGKCNGDLHLVNKLRMAKRLAAEKGYRI
jgi:hypothetical protein